MTKEEALELEALKYAASMGHGGIVREMSTPFTIKEALAQPPEPRNFCPRCGKRLIGMAFAAGGVHTCTPPEGETHD